MNRRLSERIFFEYTVGEDADEWQIGRSKE